MSRTTKLVVTCFSLALFACEGPPGAEGIAGDQGPQGPQGDPGAPGTDGVDGVDGVDGRSPWLAGPGLAIEIMSAQIAADGTVSATFRITDGAGTPLDLDGVFSEGTVSPRFIAAWLDQDAAGNPLSYTAYTTRDQTSPITSVTETQASTDSGGTFTEMGVGDGIYVYEFGTAATSVDTTKTHTIGVYATRNYQGDRYVANATYDFLPGGGTPTVAREVVSTQACNQCHNPLEAHGGSRRDTGLCILCHSPQSTDPDTGNTVDFRVMIHKIHRGHNLPSVAAGTPYQIIGYMQSVHDFSTVGFPRDIDNCTTCHQGAQASLWMNQPSRSACGSCHDLTSFEATVPPGMVAHTGGTQTTDNNCTNCHPSTGGAAGVADVHLPQVIDPASPTVELAINDATNTAPGQTPEITFTVTVDGTGRDILTSPMNSLRVTVGGPTADVSSYWQATVQGGGAAGTLTAVDAASGVFHYVFPTAMPVDATGSYAIGMEGYIQPVAGGPRYAAFNPVTYVAVTDTAPAPRRQVVSVASCDSCHYEIEAHGGQRKNPQYCVLCHNPNNTGDERVSRYEGETVTAQSVDFKVMIHKIHRGEDLVQGYLLGGFPAPNAGNPGGTPVQFGEVRFPGDLRSCGTCHVAGSYSLPLASTVLPSRAEELTCTEDPAADGDDYCNTRSSVEWFTPPTTAVCTSCHDSVFTIAHAEIMTTAAGVESCTTCHGPGSVYDIGAVHRLDP